MKIIYQKDNGNIIRTIPDDQDYLIFYQYYPQEFKDNLASVVVEEVSIDLKKYKIIDGKLVLKTPEELNPFDIDKTKNNLICLSKISLTQYLQNNPLLFSDGKYYSVTQEKQNLLNNAITVYQMKVQLGLPAELKWNATGEECTEWTLENIVTLALSIANYVEPLVTYQQAIEVQIKQCTTKEELESIVIDYATV